VTTGIQKNCLDTGFRRYDKLDSDTHLCGAVLSSNRMLVLSGKEFCFLTAEDLVQAIQAGALK